jgi:hypothetical protein
MNISRNSGVVLADRNTITSENIGALTQALITFYDRYHALAWIAIVIFLSQTAR